MVIGPVKPKHCAVNGWLVSPRPNIGLGGSATGLLCHQLTDAGDTDIGMELNWPVAVNCAWPPCAVMLAGLTLRDRSWRLLPHPDKVPTAKMNTVKRRLHSVFMHSSETCMGRATRPSVTILSYACRYLETIIFCKTMVVSRDTQNSVWNEFLKISLHDPIIWFALLAAVILVFGLRAEARRRRLLEQFALARGFKFDRTFNRGELRLSEAHFFSWRDRVKNAVSGCVNGMRFTLFEQHANRGKYKSFTRTIVAFEIDPSAPVLSGALGGYGLQMEKTSSHLFVWQGKRRVPPAELEPFLQSTVRNVEQAIH